MVTLQMKVFVASKWGRVHACLVYLQKTDQDFDYQLRTVTDAATWGGSGMAPGNSRPHARTRSHSHPTFDGNWEVQVLIPHSPCPSSVHHLSRLLSGSRGSAGAYRFKDESKHDAALRLVQDPDWVFLRTAEKQLNCK